MKMKVIEATQSRDERRERKKSRMMRGEQFEKTSVLSLALRCFVNPRNGPSIIFLRTNILLLSEVFKRNMNHFDIVACYMS